MLLKTVLEQEKQRLNVSWETMEQDYVLSWILFGISSIPELNQKLAFKGGTALKKCYFGEYRFSQDLDFSCLDGAPSGDHLEQLLNDACENARQELNRRIANPIFTCSRYTEKMPHPHGQEAFVIRAQLPWHRTPYVRIMVEVTRNQLVVEQPVLRKVIHGYNEDFDCHILSYTIEEIFAEKLQAILDNTKKIHERKWTRSRARDYYDLWRMLQTFPTELRGITILQTLVQKCEGRKVQYQNVNDFFDHKALTLVEQEWDEWLGPMIHPLPAYELVLTELRWRLANFLK